MIQYIPMNAGHVGQIAELEKLCFSDPWSERSLVSELTAAYSYWLVAVDGDRVVGYVGSQSSFDEADMMNIAVHPDYRRRGVAEQLVTLLCDGLAAKNVHVLMLEVRASNEPAKTLYGKLGFAQVGRRPNYYRNPKEDALILRKEWAL